MCINAFICVYATDNYRTLVMNIYVQARYLFLYYRVQSRHMIQGIHH